MERDFGGSIDGSEPCEVFIVVHDDAPIGLIQRYLISSYPDDLVELRTLVPVPQGALSLDYFIGAPDLIGQGLGTTMIREMVEKSWVDHPSAGAIIVPVAVANPRSWRALLAAGFTRIATGYLAPDNPIDDGRHHVFRMDRP